MALLDSLETWNKSSFPNILNKVILVNVNIPMLLADTETRQKLKQGIWTDKLLITPENFRKALFSEIQQSTCFDCYYGDLEEPLFELNQTLVGLVKDWIETEKRGKSDKKEIK